MVIYCIVNGCRNTQNSHSQHKFPVDPELKAQWLAFCGRDAVYEGARICEGHFLSSDFSARNYGKVPNGKNKLIRGAVPSQNSPEEIASGGYQSPAKTTPTKKFRRHHVKEVVLFEETLFVSVMDLIDHLHYLPPLYQDSALYNHRTSVCQFFVQKDHSTVYQRVLKFCDSLKPVYEVHGQPYTGSLLSHTEVLSSTCLDSVLSMFFAVRVCCGIGAQVQTRCQPGEFVVDSYSADFSAPLFRAVGCGLVIPGRPASMTRCMNCQTLATKLQRRVVPTSHATQQSNCTDYSLGQSYVAAEPLFEPEVAQR